MLPALIIVTTIATSSTGGNTVGPGGVVQTGSESASSYVRTEVGGDSTSTITVETNTNSSTSTVHATSVHKPVPKVHRTVVTTQALSTSTASSTAAATSSIDIVVEPPSAMVPPPLGVRLMALITGFIRSLFSFVQ
jgi:hypothetical protein